MGHGVRLGVGGRLEVVRRAPPEDPDRLRATIGALQAAAGRGTVEILDVHDSGDEVELVLGFAGRASSAPMPGAGLGMLAAAAAAHLADLHLRGVAHGAIEAAHVLHDAGDGVRLCGFVPGATDTAGDVEAMGVLLRELLDPADRSPAAAAVRAIATRCCTESVESRPTMAAVAASLAAISSVRRAVSPSPTATRTPRWRHGAVVGAVSVAALGALALAVDRSPTPAEPAFRAPSTTVVTAATTTTHQPAGVRVWPRPVAPIEGDGARWAFDRTGLVLMGDWDCDGDATPVLVDGGGAIWVIDRWLPAAEIPSRFVTVVERVADADVVSGASCDELVVRTADGRSVRPPVRA